MKKLIIQIKTLPTAIAQNSYSLPQTIFLAVLIGVALTGTLYLFDHTVLDPNK